MPGYMIYSKYEAANLIIYTFGYFFSHFHLRMCTYHLNRVYDVLAKSGTGRQFSWPAHCN